MKDIIKHFNVEGELASYVTFGNGHICDTYLVSLHNGDHLKKYTLQRINNSVFPDVEGLMNNIERVTEHVKQKIIENGGNPKRNTLSLVKTIDGKSFYKEGDNYYRMYPYIRDAFTLDVVSDIELLKESARAFANFQKMLSDFDASKLVEIIPNFHNTIKRFEHFVKVLNKDKYNRARSCKKEIDFILERKDDCSRIVNLIEEGKIPLRVTHNDTKLNNVLLDEKTKKGICVIDLDTVMPGSSLYDFGDAIRFGCNTALEDEEDLSKVQFSLDYFKGYTEAYLEILKDTLCENEIKNLAFAGKLLTLECGIRFLDDYLNGDHYFKISYPTHNLVRAKNQLKLVKEMEKHMDEMEKIVEELCK